MALWWSKETLAEVLHLVVVHLAPINFLVGVFLCLLIYLLFFQGV